MASAANIGGFNVADMLADNVVAHRGEFDELHAGTQYIDDIVTDLPANKVVITEADGKLGTIDYGTGIVAGNIVKRGVGGAIALQSSDVTGGLGYVPVDPAADTTISGELTLTHSNIGANKLVATDAGKKLITMDYHDNENNSTIALRTSSGGLKCKNLYVSELTTNQLMATDNNNFAISVPYSTSGTASTVVQRTSTGALNISNELSLSHAGGTFKIASGVNNNRALADFHAHGATTADHGAFWFRRFNNSDVIMEIQTNSGNERVQVNKTLRLNALTASTLVGLNASKEAVSVAYNTESSANSIVQRTAAGSIFSGEEFKISSVTGLFRIIKDASEDGSFNVNAQGSAGNGSRGRIKFRNYQGAPVIMEIDTIAANEQVTINRPLNLSTLTANKWLKLDASGYIETTDAPSPGVSESTGTYTPTVLLDVNSIFISFPSTVKWCTIGSMTFINGEIRLDPFTNGDFIIISLPSIHAFTAPYQLSGSLNLGEEYYGNIDCIDDGSSKSSIKMSMSNSTFMAMTINFTCTFRAL